MAEAQTNLSDREIDRSQMKVSDEVAIEIQNMNKWYGTFHVLRDINLTVYRGERIVICGPSGSGKSTLIRCINALEEHQQGPIVVDGTRAVERPQEHRQAGPRSGWCSSTSTCSRT
jgi:general L-amino acid transport system ATP-binding protein